MNSTDGHRPSQLLDEFEDDLEVRGLSGIGSRSNWKSGTTDPSADILG